MTKIYESIVPAHTGKCIAVSPQVEGFPVLPGLLRCTFKNVRRPWYWFGLQTYGKSFVGYLDAKGFVFPYELAKAYYDAKRTQAETINGKRWL